MSTKTLRDVTPYAIGTGIFFLLSLAAASSWSTSCSRAAR